MASNFCDARLGFEFEMCKLKLGSGSSGIVFLAQHRHTHELAAVKRLFTKGIVADDTPVKHISFSCHPPTQSLTVTPERTHSPVSLVAPSCVAATAFPDDGKRCRGLFNNNAEMGNDEGGMDAEEDNVDLQGDEELRAGGLRKSPLWVKTPRVGHHLSESTILQYLGPHPHIVKFLGSYTNSKRVTFFAMELMDSDLGRELRAANTAFMMEDIARPLLHGVITAISHLHKHGITHRDIKPSNILLKRVDMARVLLDSSVGDVTTSVCGVEYLNSGRDKNSNCYYYTMDNMREKQGVSAFKNEEERVKATLGDFSAAHFIYESENVGSRVGTSYYKSPEQLMGRVEDYLACDMWALGCTMFELATGSVAFCGSTDLQVLHQICAKLGTDFQYYPENTQESTLFNSLSSPSAAYLDFLKSLLTLDPRKRLTASEALKHAFFDPIRETYDIDGKDVEVTFPLRSRCRKTVDRKNLTFRPIVTTPTKRSRATVAEAGGGCGNGGISQFSFGLNPSDISLSVSCLQHSTWSSSASATPSPSLQSTRMQYHHESVETSRIRSCLSGRAGNCTAARRLSISSCLAGATAHVQDENSRTVVPSLSPIALCFSPATSVKPCGGTLASQSRVPRLNPSSNVVLGNTRTSILFERNAFGGCGTGRGSTTCAAASTNVTGVGGLGGPTEPRVLFEGENHSCRYDADSPSVRKMLFESPLQPLRCRLNESLDKTEGNSLQDDHDVSSQPWKLALKSPPLFMTTSESSLPLLDFSFAHPTSGGDTHNSHSLSHLNTETGEDGCCKTHQWDVVNNAGGKRI